MIIQNDSDLQQAQQRLSALMQNQAVNAQEIIQLQNDISEYMNKR